MRSILKTLVLAPTPKKWHDYNTHFASFFDSRDALYDRAISLLRDFYIQFDAFPSFDALKTELTVANEQDLLTYITNAVTDDSVPILTEDGDFVSFLSTSRRLYLELDLQTAQREFQTKLATLSSGNQADLLKVVDEYITTLHKTKQKALRSDQSTSMLLYGERAQRDLEEAYHRIVQQALSDETLYYTLGFKGFDPVQIKRGDLVFFGGFTSHGKSVLLRYASYRMLVEYGLNVAFWSFEMKAETVRLLFVLLHANNKKIFPNTPRIKYEDYKHGRLNDEQADFLFNTAAKDLFNNPAYGSLYIDQPNKSRFNMVDLTVKLSELENSLMPMHIVVLDYLTMMYPLNNDRGQPGRADYNQMIKDFKNMALAHRNAKGESAPFIGLTAAQISRAGYENAMKNNGLYEISAFAEYSEIERSADSMFSVLMSPEMRASSQLRIQCHKNRDGAVPLDALNLYVDLEAGFGLSEIAERNEAEVVAALQTLNI